MRTTVTLDGDEYAAAMHLAGASGERLGKVLSKLARRGLAPPPSPAPKKATRRFPTFDVPLDAPIIPASKVQRVMVLGINGTENRVKATRIVQIPLPRQWGPASYR